MNIYEPLFNPFDANDFTKFILNYQEFPFSKQFSYRFIRKPKFVGSGLLESPAFEQTLTAQAFSNSVFQRSFALIISILHWFQAVNLFKNLLEQGFRHQHLCHLKRYISSMADGKIDFHSLRHTFGSLLAASDVHLKIAQELMRHSNINLTMGIYTHAQTSQVEAAVNNRPDLQKHAKNRRDAC